MCRLLVGGPPPFDTVESTDGLCEVPAVAPASVAARCLPFGLLLHAATLAAAGPPPSLSQHRPLVRAEAPRDVRDPWWAEIANRIERWQDRVHARDGGFVASLHQVALEARWDEQGRLRVEPQPGVLAAHPSPVEVVLVGVED